MHNWRRDGDEIWGSSDGGGSNGDLCRWWGWSGFGPFACFLLDHCGRERGSTWRVVPEGIPYLGDAADERGTLAAFLLLKGATPSESSSSDIISKTRFPLSRGVGAGDEATARGTAAMGGGESGV